MVLKNDYKRIRKLVRKYEKECSLLLDQTKHSNTIKKAILEKNSQQNIPWVIDYYIKQGYKGLKLIKILEREFAVSKYEMIDCYSYLDAAYMAVFEMYKKEFPALDDLSEEGKQLFPKCFESIIEIVHSRTNEDPCFAWDDFKKELDSHRENDCLFFPEIKEFKNELNKVV